MDAINLVEGNIHWLGMAWALGGSSLVTAAVLWSARRMNRLVAPVARSAHSRPMPTAGGIGIVAGFLLGFLESFVAMPLHFIGAIGLLSLVVIDDVLRPLKVGEKTLLLVAAIGVFMAGGELLEQITFPWLGRVPLGLWAWPLTLCWFFWICNVFNFMDGIDGISATQAICIAGWIGLLLWDVDLALAQQAWILAAAVLGFAFFNVPPARIFMGDVGSLFIGFALAGLAVQSEHMGLPLWHFAVLMGYYLFDTSYTLIRRIARGENPLQAHNKHLYQRLTRLGWSHWRIDLWAGGITMLNGAGVFSFQRGDLIFAAVLWCLSCSALMAVLIWAERREPSFA
jgi:UDP-N-acetylmuramyl pentapeptide phosphotransferase/UDP-N-acetylglucosamine-1-phosphate transferase